MRSRAALGLVMAAGLLAGCGATQHRLPGDRIPGKVLTIYFSGPSQGASSLAAGAALNGARVALDHAHGRVGSYQIRLRALDDASVASGGWDPNQTTLDARMASQDPTTIGYLGDYNSGASAVSIPLLNRLGIAQISPASSAVGLTSTGPGAAPGEPEKYYPTGVRTFARVVPSDAEQAKAIIAAEQAAGCRGTFVLEDGEVDGEAGALTYLLTAQSEGQRVLAVQAFQPQALDYTALARSVAASGADCVLLSALDEASAARVTLQVGRAVPQARIFATSGLADAAYVGALSGEVAPRVTVVSPGLPASHYPPSGRAFLADYARRFGAPPPSAIFGFQAMSLMLAAIARATDHGHRPAERSKVRDELFSGRRIAGVVGSFRIESTGDTSLRSFAIYRIVNGQLALVTRTG